MLPACWQGKRTNISFDQTKDISCLGRRTNSSRSLKDPNDFLIQAILLMLRSHDRMSQYALFPRNCTTKRSPTRRCSSFFEHFIAVIFTKKKKNTRDRLGLVRGWWWESQQGRTGPRYTSVSSHVNHSRRQTYLSMKQTQGNSFRNFKWVGGK